MKKTLLIVAFILVALGALGVGVAFAQGQQPPNRPFGPGMMGQNIDGDFGVLHDYMISAYADALGISVDDLNSRLAAGETMYQIALDKGLTQDEFSSLMQDARSMALDAAVADGVISQDQADWMNSRGFGRGGMMGGYGYGNGDCPMFDGHPGGFGPGAGGGRGGRWQQAPQGGQS